MNKYLIAALATTLISHQALAMDNIYLKLDAGMHRLQTSDTKSKDAKKLSWKGHFGAGVGKQFTPELRADLSFTYFLTPSNSDEVKWKVATLMLGGYYDIDLSDSITPYIGAKVGISSVHIKYNIKPTTKFATSNTTGSQTTITPAFTGNLGAAMKISDDLYLDAGYNYYYLGKHGKGSKEALIAHAFSAGIRFMM